MYVGDFKWYCDNKGNDSQVKVKGERDIQFWQVWLL